MPQRKSSSRAPLRRAGGWILNIAIIAAVFYAVQLYKSRPLVDGQAPALEAALTTGAGFDLAAWRGEPVLVHFWAEWCPVCKLEEGGIARLSRDFRVVTIALQSGDAAEVGAYLAGRALDFPTINDPDGRIAERWGVRGVPASFVLDSEGEIRFASVGYSPGIGLRAQLWLTRALW
jgi:peroxiredoxin